MYWYNAGSNRCEPRTYGGCEGNANRFERLAACEQDCAQVFAPGEEPLPVAYDFSDNCDGDALTEEGRQIVTDFVDSRAQGPTGDEPYILVRLMARNGTCMRSSDVYLTGTGVEAFVDYIEFGELGYLPVHESQFPRDIITTDLAELSLLLGVEAEVTWR